MSKKWNISGIETWGWKKAPKGGAIPTAGNAEEYKTGGWRTDKPIWHEEKCTH